MIGKNISAYLRDNGIKQSWLAERLGIPITTLSGAMTGRVHMKAEMFMKICEILRVPPETFNERKED